MATSLSQLNPPDYQRLFRIKGLRFLVNDIWMNYYKQFYCIALVIDDEYTSYMPQKVMTKTLKEGLEMYKADPTSPFFPLFEKIFSTHFEKTILLGQQLLQQQSISKNDLQEFLQELSQCFHYYSRTEFFYTDMAFEASGKNKNLDNACKFIASLKAKGRQQLNTLFFGEKAILNRILRQLSGQFSIPVVDLQEYGIKELGDLFESEKLPPEELAQRREAFLMIGDGKSVTYFMGQEAKEKIALFQQGAENTSDISEIKGVIANKGIVQGKVRRIVSEYGTFDQLPSIIAQMNKGEILVSETTAPELLLACQKAAAIVTDQGGLLSHAAIISRELGIPCIVGTQFATKIFHDGDLVEVDAEKGLVRKIDK